jgi:hypothetical protein
VPCPTPLPHRLIPPLIKRSRILVSGGVVLVSHLCNFNKFCGYDVCSCGVPCRKIPVSRHPPIKLEQKVALYVANKTSRPLPGEMLLRDRLPTFLFQLSFLLFTLYCKNKFHPKKYVQLASIRYSCSSGSPR